VNATEELRVLKHPLQRIHGVLDPNKRDRGVAGFEVKVVPREQYAAMIQQQAAAATEAYAQAGSDPNTYPPYYQHQQHQQNPYFPSFASGASMMGAMNPMGGGCGRGSPSSPSYPVYGNSGMMMMNDGNGSTMMMDRSVSGVEEREGWARGEGTLTSCARNCLSPFPPLQMGVWPTEESMRNCPVAQTVSAAGAAMSAAVTEMARGFTAPPDLDHQHAPRGGGGGGGGGGGDGGGGGGGGGAGRSQGDRIMEVDSQKERECIYILCNLK
jgi:hypothetical protein